MATSDAKKKKGTTQGLDDSAFRTPSELSDVVLVVEGRPLHVNRSVLSLISPVFLKMFNGEWKGKTEVPLADKTYDHFVELLLCAYPPQSKLISMETLDVILPLADEYGIESIKLRCEEFVLARLQHRDKKFNTPPNKELVHFLYLADKFKLNSLLEESVEKVIHRSYDGKDGVKKLNEFGLLSPGLKYRITSERLSLLETPLREHFSRGMIDFYLRPAMAHFIFDPKVQ
ncbi:speckle-type POZ protein B-like [Haliotis asinina]|uniref:speckle-type POZ protein B-like n=1 Tax=Haliotis asinina TaxID=109174 RepID=UPI003532346E